MIKITMLQKSLLKIAILFLSWTISTMNATSRSSSGGTEMLGRCIRIGEPLVHEPRFVFPQSVEEIRQVCVKWDEFVSCIRLYTSAHLTVSQQKEFDTVINPSMGSIHQLCVRDERYEKAYLYYAPCMKKIAIEAAFCGDQYSYLAEEAKNGKENGPNICCGYHEFRACVLHEASRECQDLNMGPKRPDFDGNLAHFASKMLERALGFLNQKCDKYKSENHKCVYHFKIKDLKRLNATEKLFGSSSTTNTIPGRNGRRIDVFQRQTGNRERLENTENRGSRREMHGNRFDNDGRSDLMDQETSNPRNEASFDHRETPNPTVVSYSSRHTPHVTAYPPKDIATKRFTWTTPTPSYFPTKNYTFELLSNDIMAPESQKYRSDGISISNQLKTLYYITLAHLTYILLNNICRY